MSYSNSNIKLFFVASSFFLIAYAWVSQNESIAISGAILYLLIILYEIIGLVINSKKIKEDENIEVTPNKSEKVTTVLEGALVLFSLFAIISDYDLYRFTGQIIWFGQIGVFILGGPIIEFFTGIPMKMTYGGWRVRRHNRRRKL